MSTVIDDWGEHAYFSGMPIGSIGPSYSFNGGRSSIAMENGDDLVVAKFGNGRGLIVREDPVILSIFCPSLLLTISVVGIESGFVFEKGRPADTGGSILWSTDLLYDERHSQGTRIKLYTHHSLGTWSYFRLSNEYGGLIQSIVNVDCSECANSPSC